MTSCRAGTSAAEITPISQMCCTRNPGVARMTNGITQVRYQGCSAGPRIANESNDPQATTQGLPTDWGGRGPYRQTSQTKEVATRAVAIIVSQEMMRDSESSS